MAISTAACLFLGAWSLLYPGPAEPKNPRYVLWTLGLPVANLDDAVETMVGDRHPDRLVVGKTREELTSRFGYVTPLASASSYLQACYASSSWRGDEIVFLRH